MTLEKGTVEREEEKKNSRDERQKKKRESRKTEREQKEIRDNIQISPGYHPVVSLPRG